LTEPLVSDEEMQRVSGFGRFLRQTFGTFGRDGDRIRRHMLHQDLNDLWWWVSANPSTLTGPHVGSGDLYP
jgi:hypothetical protein